MKKNDFIFPAIFLVIILFLFIIPIGAFLTSEIIGWKTTKRLGGWVYNFLKDHGSLIAGIIAIFGVAWLVNTQKNETNKIIKSNDDVVRYQDFETRRMKALESAFIVQERLATLRGIRPFSFYGWNNSPSGRDHFKSAKLHLYFINDFIGESNPDAIQLYEVVEKFIELYENDTWINSAARGYVLADFALVLGCLMNVNLNRLVDDSNFGYYSGITFTPGNLMSSFKLYNSFSSYSDENKCGYLISYISGIVMPELINRMKCKKLDDN